MYMINVLEHDVSAQVYEWLCEQVAMVNVMPDTGREESVLVSGMHGALARSVVHMWSFGEHVG